ncbi:MAG: V-type ATP synthase subunit A [Bacillota bacterium]
MNDREGIITLINGPVVKGRNMAGFKMREMVMVGNKKLIGEVIALDGDLGTIQVYEETEGLKSGEKVIPTGKPLSLKLGPGLIGNIFDGIERPLVQINEMSQGFIPEGIGLISIDTQKRWDIRIQVKVGDFLEAGHVYGVVQETSLVEHKLLVPPEIAGEVTWVKEDGSYTIEEQLVVVKDRKGHEYCLTMYQEWPVRDPRPVYERLAIEKPLVTGQRVLDIFFPVAKGGTAAIPGGFGTGKTMTQHQLAKWSDADIIVYIGCGERGNEMTEVLEDFPKLIDPKTNKPIMERTILIANTSNMPVAAREASIYTGITIAEYFRDMGYHVAIMADSTSRWAEALREISGRLEEMPAEEGYPAYLPSRLAEFYERAGYVTTLGGQEASITIIGAVSPAGGDFSEPVTENTKRYVNAFLALDKKLAYARHYPSINWLTSYSGYIKVLAGWYKENVSDDVIELRPKMMRILHEENKLQEIVQLVGEDVLPDEQRLILEISKVLKIGFLQQNAFHKEDTFVPLEKQYHMLKLIDYLYEKGLDAVKKGVPISQAKDDRLFNEVMKMKYNIPNDDLSGLDRLAEEIDQYYHQLLEKYK